MTKPTIRRRYQAGIIGLSDALQLLMFEHDMMRGEALRYLGL